ncbi:hypothetical protein PoB_004421000 [Plakobranchus ocellatus]|uniref:Uncharacterized protein n=1 Tax=Plakobranchus ocellatus TaxID=259542 RepID=A0AAV4BDS1_9GAST|nr:hypothetical protein PoB_004421000 [Plakobranchus ocellatus]
MNQLMSSTHNPRLQLYTNQTLGALLHVLIWTSSFPCVISNSADSNSSCELTSTLFIQYNGSFEVGKCNTSRGILSLCVALCEIVTQCKIVHNEECDGVAKNCLCACRTKVKSFNSADANAFFYMHTVEMTASAKQAILVGGLVAGQSLIIKISLASTSINCSFLTSNGNFALMVEFYFTNGKGLANSSINKIMSEEDLNKPYFNFQDGQEENPFLHVTSTAFVLTIDSTVFKNFPNCIIDLSSISEFRLLSKDLHA